MCLDIEVCEWVHVGKRYSNTNVIDKFVCLFVKLELVEHAA